MAQTTINSGGITDGAIVNADVKSDAAIAGSKFADDSITEAKLDIHDAPATGEFLGYTSNGLEWVNGNTTIADNSVTAGKTDISIVSGDIDESNNWVDANISAESAEVKGIANAVWTQSVKDAFKAKLIAEKPA